MKVTLTQEIKDFFLTHGEDSYKDSNEIDVDTLFKIYSKVSTEYNIKKNNPDSEENKQIFPSLQELVLNSRKELDNYLSQQNKENVNSKSIIEILRKRSEERRYQSYIKNLSQAKYNRISNNVPDAFGIHYSRDVLMSINALIGLVLTFIGGFYAPIYMGIVDLNIRIFIGIGCSIICLIAEVALFMIYDVKRNMKVLKAKKEDPVYRFLNKNKQNVNLSNKDNNQIYNNNNNNTQNNNNDLNNNKTKYTNRYKKGKKHKQD